MPKTLQHSTDTQSERFIPSTYVKRLQPTSFDTDDGDNDIDNTIDCPCGDNDEDSGFTIQCEQCLTWQHGECVAIVPNDVPHNYVCYACQSHIPKVKKDHLHNKQQKQYAAVGNKPTDNSSFDGEHSRDIFSNTLTGNIEVKPSLSNKKLRLKQKGQMPTDKSILEGGKRKQRSCEDDDADDDGDGDEETVTPYDYSATSSTLINRRSNNGTRTSRASTRFEQLYRNIIRNKLVKQTMKEAREQWQINNGDMDDTMVSVDSSLLLPTIPKVSVRPLWKSLAHGSGTSQNDPSVRKGVFAEIHVPENRFLLEINGEILIKSAYKCDPTSLYPLLHTPEDHLFFYPSLDLLIDARQFGNDSRFVRRSCHPNAQVKCITLSHNDDQTMHLGLFTMEEVDKGDEISIAWDWQRGTSLWKNYMQWKRQPMETFEDHQVESMLAGFEKEFGECACQDKNECFVEYLKDTCQSTKTTKNDKKTTTQRRRGSDSSDSRLSTQPKRRRSKDHAQSKKKPAQEQSQQKAVGGKLKKRRSSTTNTSVTISMDTRNDLFFASLPVSRSTSPVQHGKHITTLSSEDSIKLEKKCAPSSRLPCKKAWMKTYLAQTTDTPKEPKPDILKKEVIDDFWNDSSDQAHGRSMDDLVMDESMGDDSSTATLPGGDTDFPAQKETLDPFLSSSAIKEDPASKPVKVSLKQYQSMQKKSIPGPT